MAQAQRYKLKLKQLDFVSLVDDPAQPNAKCLLIKRKDGGKSEIEATARLVKTNDELGLAFFWAFTSTNADGSAHYDLHGDQVVADDTMIKAAMAFMENGGAVDEMHDSDPDGGRVVFAMPMTPEIAKAFGVETKTSGLMIAIKPSAEAMVKLKDGTYRAVSIAGLGERETVKGAGRVVKSTLYTDLVDGHQHEVCVCDDGSLYVRYATSEGADREHSHGIVFENGQLTILADSGHTHVLAEGQPGVAIVPADAIVVVQASASPTKNVGAARNTTETGASKSTRQAPARDNDSMKIVILSEAQHAHYSKLGASEQEAFVNKSAAERDAEVQKALDADPIVFKGERSGLEVRKSQGDFALKLAKQAEENAATVAKQAEELAKRDAEIRKQAVIAKRNEVFQGKAPGKDEVLDRIIEKFLGDDEALAVFKGLVAVSKLGDKAPGANGGLEPSDNPALDAFNKGLVEFAKSKNTTPVLATSEFISTTEGATLYAATQAQA